MPGQAHGSTQFETLMAAVRVAQPKGRPRSRAKRVAGEKGYSFDRIRTWLRRYAIGAVIPQRSDQAARRRGRPLTFDREAYRRRSIIECCAGRPPDLQARTVGVSEPGILHLGLAGRLTRSASHDGRTHWLSPLEIANTGTYATVRNVLSHLLTGRRGFPKRRQHIVTQW